MLISAQTVNLLNTISLSVDPKIHNSLATHNGRLQVLLKRGLWIYLCLFKYLNNVSKRCQTTSPNKMHKALKGERQTTIKEYSRGGNYWAKRNHNSSFEQSRRMKEFV